MLIEEILPDMQVVSYDPAIAVFYKVKRLKMGDSKKSTIKIMLGLLVLITINLTGDSGYGFSKYEPPDGKVIHGLGQYVPYYYTDAENWQYVSEYQETVGSMPVIYSVYVSLDPDSDLIDATDPIAIIKDRGHQYLLNIGISLQSVQSWLAGSASIPASSILNGEWDSRIKSLAQQIKSLNAPVYARPGFEFGEANKGVHSDPRLTAAEFKAIWIYIHNFFKKENVTNVAWVWNTVNPWMFDYNEWYPGSPYVDWWGINYFTREQMILSDPFIEDAKENGKPVMICESSPIHNDGAGNPENWGNWYRPFFNKIMQYEHIKAFIYISDPWDKDNF